MIDITLFDLFIFFVLAFGFIALFALSLLAVFFAKSKIIIIPAVIIIGIGLWQVGSGAVLSYRWNAWIDDHKSVAKSPAPTAITTLHVTCEDNAPFAPTQAPEVTNCIWESEENLKNLAVMLHRNGGFLETGTDPVLRWNVEQASEACFDPSLNIQPATDNSVYDEALYVRGICFNLVQVDTPGAEYHLEARRDINPVTPDRVYSDQTLIHRPSEMVIDHVALASMIPEFGFFSAINMISPWGEPDTVTIRDYENSAIRALFASLPWHDEIWFEPQSEEDEYSTLHYVNEYAPWDDTSALLALQSGENDYELAWYASQVCYEWNSAGPAVRSRLEEIFETRSDNPRIAELSEICGISSCRLGSYGIIAPRTECIIPRVTHQE